MVTPRLLQVINYFQNSKIVKSLSSHQNFEFKSTSKIYLSLGCYWYTLEDGTSELIWSDTVGYAKILENK